MLYISEQVRSKTQFTAYVGDHMQQGDTSSLLIRVQTYAAALEINMAGEVVGGTKKRGERENHGQDVK